MGEIFKSRGEIIIFQKQRGNVLKQAKLGGGNFKFVVKSMTFKKVIRNFGR